MNNWQQLRKIFHAVNPVSFMAIHQPCLQPCRIVVERHLCGETNLPEDAVRIAMLPHVCIDVRVTAEENVRAVAAAGGEQTAREAAAPGAAAMWVVRGIVHLDENMLLRSGACHCISIDGIGGVVGMSDDRNVGIFHCA